MRKSILKKIVASVLTMAMTVSMVAFPNMEAEAAESYLYAYGSFNNWSGEDKLTSIDGITYAGDITLNEGSDDLYFEATQGNWDTCIEPSSVSADDVTGGIWDSEPKKIWVTATAGTYTFTYNTETTVLTIALKSASTITYTYEYYVTGADEFEAESWNNTDVSTIANNGKMTSNGDGTWTYTAHTSADFDGSAGYTIKKLGTPDDGSDKTFTDVKWFENCNYSGAGILTITYNVDAWTSEVTFVQDELITIGAQSQANATESTKYDLGFVTTISDVVIDNNKVEDIKEMGIIVINSGEADVYAFRSVIKGISDTAKEYTAVPYITYENGTTVYGSMLTRSVDDTLATP